jgi:hypothetical protein
VVLADVDWQAVGAVATGIAALVTAAMAIYTGSMAKATRRIAEKHCALDFCLGCAASWLPSSFVKSGFLCREPPAD